MPLKVFIGIKFVGGALLMLPWLIRHWRPIAFKAASRIFIATFIGYFLNILLLYEGLKQTSGSSASLIIALGPVILYALSIEVLKEKFNSKILFGLIISGLGTFLVIVAPLLGAHLRDVSLKGNLLVSLSVLADVVGTILIKPALKQVKSGQLTAIRFMIAAVLFLGVSAKAVTHFSYSTIPISGYIAIFYGMVVSLVISNSLYHYGLSKITVEQGSVLNYLDPIFGIIASILILGEKLNTTILIGAALTFWGIYVAEAKLRPRLSLLHHQRH